MAKKWIKMKKSMAGPGESWKPGDVRQVEAEIADAWCDPSVGIAEPFTPPRKKSTRAAVKDEDDTEKAVLPKAKPTRRRKR